MYATDFYVFPTACRQSQSHRAPDRFNRIKTHLMYYLLYIYSYGYVSRYIY